MSSSFLEIVELPNGDIVLQRADDDDTPLVTIQFSEESKEYLLDNALEVARAMIQAGIQTAAQMAEQGHIVITESSDDADEFGDHDAASNDTGRSSARSDERADDLAEDSMSTEAPRVLH